MRNLAIFPCFTCIPQRRKIFENLHQFLWDISPKQEKRDIVSRKKTDLLTTGLSSELFLLAYLEPNNIRQLGKKLQNTSGHPTNYSKVNPAIHNLTVKKYLKHNENGKFYPNIEKLGEELEVILKEKSFELKNDEKLFLTKILEQNEFFKIISQDIIKKIQDQDIGVHKINAIDVFCERIGVLSSGVLMHKKFDKSGNLDLYDPKMSFDENFTDIQELWKEMYEGAENKMKEFEIPLIDHPAVKELLLPIMKNLPSLMIFYLIPITALEKFIMLWKGSEGVKLSLDMIKQFVKD